MAQISKLVLHPQDTKFGPKTWQNIQLKLRACGFIGTSLPGYESRFLSGDHFLQYISFMGCSPAIEFEPPEDGSLDFCHIQFSDLDDSQPRFRHHSQGVMARCPECGRRLEPGLTLVDNFLKNPSQETFRCESCEFSGSVGVINWRQRGGLARVFVDVYSVYPQEGIPTEPLLKLLQDDTGVPWTYFYTDH